MFCCPVWMPKRIGCVAMRRPSTDAWLESTRRPDVRLESPRASGRGGWRHARCGSGRDARNDLPSAVARRGSHLRKHARHRVAGHAVLQENSTPDAVDAPLDVIHAAVERVAPGKMTAIEEVPHLVRQGGGQLLIIEAIHEGPGHRDAPIRPGPGT